ncbi:hypothetical protein HPB49_008483 [Dermacentor silvarum]|uniref:Uncharacterized protein n=1 Tax=Dermacentor silvarum TaxID=543639 RepID=A0ACB8DBZ8_DERSI|nr:hypothetical protein HPB49_008483 [Dermacentor silvarum]
MVTRTGDTSATHSLDHGPAHSADWPGPGPDGSGDFYEDQFWLGNANSLRPAAPYDADRQRALLEGPFHRAPVQQLSLTCPTNDPAPCSILASCSTVTKATIALGSIFEDTCTSNAQRESSRGLVPRGPLPLQAIRAREPKSKHLTCRTATGLG